MSELVGRAEAGEDVRISRRGQPVVRLVPVEQPRPPLDIAMLEALAASLPQQSQSAAELMRDPRDSTRY